MFGRMLFSMSKKTETKWFLLTKASLIWDSRKTRLSRVDRPFRNPLCRGEIHFSFSKTYTEQVFTMRSKVLQKQLVRAMGRPKKSASDECTTDEEEMIVYDVEDEIETNPDYVKENGKTYYRGQLLLTPTKHKK
ncbi:hypothetical protein TNCV_2916821 [Trichonephila clavipes]|nr:hypothetical protein TNCV_2916821 [Trichonephila clavipes]